MPLFSAEAAAALGGAMWQRERREAASSAIETIGFPTEKQEVWRYTPIDAFDPERFHPALSASGERGVGDSLAALGAALDGAIRIGTDSGFALPLSVELPTGVSISLASSRAAAYGPATVLESTDGFSALSDCFSPDPIVIEVDPGVEVASPIAVVHWLARDGASSVASFPRVVVRLGDGARASVIEVFAGGGASKHSLVVPITEIDLADGSGLSYVSVQGVDPSTWSIGRIEGRVGRDAMLSSFSLGIGGSYSRLRCDVASIGVGSTTRIGSAYFGTDDQVHDIRTLQDHRVARSMSDLTCKGAVTGSSRSVYSGLIRVRRGAVKTEAFQRNHNLVLDPGAHADSVPNLDIEENDVRCSHASTVGPVDDEQRYYLESRGITPLRAERLIVLGFFEDMVASSPIDLARPWLASMLREKIDDALLEGRSRDA